MQHFDRRYFLKGAAASLAGGSSAWGQKGKRISLVIDPHDAVAMSAPVEWAAKELSASRYDSVAAAPKDSLCVVLAGRPAPSAAESMSLSMSRVSGRQVLLATGGDARGLVYALLELG